MQRLFNSLFISAFPLLIINSCANNEPNFISQRNLDFNEGWKFIEDSIPDAQAIKYDDSRWSPVDLPHDWSIYDPPQKSPGYVGPFSKELPRGVDVGYLRGGTGWYRKELKVNKENRGKEVLLHFDGVMSEMQLWVNGKKVGEHVYGYTPFYFNITPYLLAAGEKNVIAIKVHKPMENSRWFTGAGIYRSIEISFLDAVHVETWGVGIQAEINDATNTSVTAEINVVNKTGADKEIEVQTEVSLADGLMLKLDAVKVMISGETQETIEVSGELQNPVLWDIEDPTLYSMSVKLFEDGNQVDEYVQEFGIRSIDYSAEKGFLLNGKEILLKGACIHHDNGLLGAAAFAAAEKRRVQIMKNNGYNAIRTAHNPPSKYFLEACDELGILVIDEAFDMWVKPKRKRDYHQYFQDWWKADLESMLLRDRNHPSIILWSFGNEVQERADPAGVEIGQNCIDVIRSIDDSRPITQAVCGFWDNPSKVWEESAPAFDILDISGYNYQWANYKADHERYPNRVMYGSESVPKEAFENWQLVKELPYVIGDFVWTGMDYIGESGIGHAIYPGPDDEHIQLMPWPTYNAWCGDIDIIGNKKAQSYYRDILWDNSKLEILVHEPNTTANPELVSFWGWPNEFLSWNWKGHEGVALSVSVYASYQKVKLLLNGNEIGEKAISAESKYTATFQVPYEPGDLKVLGLVGNKVMEEKIIRTSGEATTISLESSDKSIDADRGSILFVRMQALDKDGLLVNNSSADINVEVRGEGELLAAGNANPKIEGSFVDQHLRLYNGNGLIIIRSNGNKGNITVTATSGDIASNILSIEAH